MTYKVSNRVKKKPKETKGGFIVPQEYVEEILKMFNKNYKRKCGNDLTKTKKHGII